MKLLFPDVEISQAKPADDKLAPAASPVPASPVSSPSPQKSTASPADSPALPQVQAKAGAHADDSLREVDEVSDGEDTSPPRTVEPSLSGSGAGSSQGVEASAGAGAGVPYDSGAGVGAPSSAPSTTASTAVGDGAARDAPSTPVDSKPITGVGKDEVWARSVYVWGMERHWRQSPLPRVGRDASGLPHAPLPARTKSWIF